MFKKLNIKSFDIKNFFKTLTKKQKIYMGVSIALIIVLIAGGFWAYNMNNPPIEPSSPPPLQLPGDNEFVAPESYSTVLVVSINPQFRLYLDADNVVLAVEPINSDAKKIEKELNLKSKPLNEAIEKIVNTANINGYIKDNATIDLRITEIKDSSIDSKAIISEAFSSTNATLEKLNLVAQVSASVAEDASKGPSNDTNKESNKEENKEPDKEPNKEPDKEPEKEDNKEPDKEPEKEPEKENDSEQEDPDQNTPNEPDDNQPNNQDTPEEPEAPACEHKNIKYNSNPDENTIPGSNKDMVNHVKYCADCNVILGKEAHKVEKNICTICGQSNFDISKKNIINASVSAGPDHHQHGEALINADGSINFNLLFQNAVESIGGNALQQYNLPDEDGNPSFTYKIPESVMKTAILKTFNISNEYFEKFKAAGSYYFHFGTHTYSDGYFYYQDPAAGDVISFTHKVIGYSDNKAGKFTVYYEYLTGGPDVDEHSHISYYAVTYSYSGFSNLTAGYINSSVQYDELEEPQTVTELVIQGFKPVVETLRVTSITKVSSTDGMTPIK